PGQNPLTDSPPPPARITSWRSRTSFSSLTDGTSNTILVGEKHVRPDRFGRGSDDSSIFNGDNWDRFSRIAGQRRRANGTVIDGSQRPLAPFPQYAITPNQVFGSYHPGLCQFVMGDGRVVALRNNIDLDTLARLAVRNDGQVISSDF